VAADLVDEVWLFHGANEIGGDGVPALDALPLSAITGSQQLKPRASETIENDSMTIFERATNAAV
jgi:diaminohydroxyphosphoribosylaminopyrimidine deaminase/5-amino-6-(5-phosphoribosylamino)uracil reductase